MYLPVRLVLFNYGLNHLPPTNLTDVDGKPMGMLSEATGEMES